MRLTGAATTAITMAVALAACGVSTPTGDSPSAAPSASGTAAFDTPTPVGLAVAAGKVWTVSASAGTVSVRTTVTTHPDLTVRVGSTPLRAAFDGQLLWVTVFGAGRVVAVDPASGRIVRHVRVPGQPEGIVAAFGAIWVVRQEARLLTRISTDGTVGPSYHLGDEPRLVTASSDSLFVSNFLDGTVTRIDPTSGATKTSTDVCTGAQGLVVAGSTVWVTCTSSDLVVAVDAQTLAVTGQLTVKTEPDAIRFVNGDIYVVTTSGPTLVKISDDPQHPAVLSATKLGDAPFLLDKTNVDAVVAGGRWWISSPSQNKVLVYTP